MGLDIIIAALTVRAPAVANAVTLGLALPFRLDVLTALAGPMRSKARKESILSLIAETKRLQPDRNFVIHGIWLESGRDAFGYMLKKNAAGARTENWDEVRIERLASEINDLAGRFAAVGLQIRHSSTPTWPKRFLEQFQKNRPRKFRAGTRVNAQSQKPPSLD